MARLMRLKVLLPVEALLDERVRKISAQARNGSFCLEPRHVDFVTALAPGLFSYVDDTGQERFLAVDAGVLVKSGAEVLVSTRAAVRGGDLGELRRIVEEEFLAMSEHEVIARSAMARIEAGFVRRFMELERHG